MNSLDAFAAAKLADLEERGLRRTLRENWREDGLWISVDGQKLLSFSCNDYLNLTHHPALKAAAIRAIETYGVGAGASRLVTGNHPLLEKLEARLAALKGSEAACIFGAGYLANTGIIPTLVGKDDLILIDELAHACLFAGTQLSPATVRIFRHNDIAEVESLLATNRAHYRHALLLTDGVFSMDGDLAPLPALAEICTHHDCWLMADDAHGLGVIGQGRGSRHAFDPAPVIPLQMGTLSKAIGGYGGYLCASKPVIDLMKTRARTVVYSTGLPPALAASALAALDLIESDSDLVKKPLANARLFTTRLGLSPAQSPIVPIILGTVEAVMSAAQTLFTQGFLVTPIRPPTVPEGTARLRFAFTAGHAAEDILHLADVVAPLMPAKAR
ncbi:aminotransferase class I/II-fold pyridoxal phosphate-dependent enzyme [Beijerinckia indica]|uniref:8-amino-7-oxononanoate synthase n=1 Tax=Beijerinckia indica subsp. indica (strain ATCC 9039 / DSM 1715 / NCIMB 8712) TaxID=395963 RepID=BIOF_BEII9|nr:aminotransferase class I/II-fold pyridoxal phosphate-dependent enzyme [Beijerinckia indica]B2IH50.1 RecName: Full=8-amino-7-oxononanoate synthase; Short=AONS; AltName: Full=7-keto-8-amino-pelargonic acid synthase; Short=7-KAP synthase; Short=KAPA synthase; AltName: Full=8-amino-7-ketopelargonate synthase; AltName: Full=Alpha-oxoamine synthase [Beijerinckia indica subsp. indica ATCC 9039]ACB94464.1 8-amino-7-oxononanoate synthase [Beijerinckia indica subsp. indica ATCC 9039]